MKAFAVGLALALLSLPVHAESTVPFSASVDTQVTPLGPCGATCLTINIAGTGHATHMGRIEIDGPSQINFATGAQTGTSTLTAADGSTIVMLFVGAFIPTGPADATFQGTWTVTGGTGRFQGASGGGTYGGSAAGDVGVLNIDGTLSSPGKKP